MTKEEKKVLAILKRHSTPFLQASCVHSNQFEEVAKEIEAALTKKPEWNDGTAPKTKHVGMAEAV